MHVMHILTQYLNSIKIYIAHYYANFVPNQISSKSKISAFLHFHFCIFICMLKYLTKSTNYKCKICTQEHLEDGIIHYLNIITLLSLLFTYYYINKFKNLKGSLVFQ